MNLVVVSESNLATNKLDMWTQTYIRVYVPKNIGLYMSFNFKDFRFWGFIVKIELQR
jgi:hypothetical protein